LPDAAAVRWIDAAAAGDHLVAAWNYAQPLQAARLTDDGRLLAPTQLMAALSSGEPRIACNRERCLVRMRSPFFAGFEDLWLCDAEGRLLAALPRAPAARAAVATDWGFLTCSTTSTKSFETSWRLLDNDGRQIAATRRMEREVAVMFDGSRLVAIAERSPDELVMEAFDPRSLVPQNTQTVMRLGPAQIVSGAAMAFNGSRYAVAVRVDDIESRLGGWLNALEVDRFFTVVTPPQPVSLTWGMDPGGVAPLGDGFVFVWQQLGSLATLRSATLRGGRLAPPAVSGGQAFLRARAEQFPKAVAQNANAVLGVWAEMDGGTSTLRGARASGGGPLDREPLMLDRAGEASFVVKAASDGSGFLVVWQRSTWGSVQPSGVVESDVTTPIVPFASRSFDGDHLIVARFVYPKTPADGPSGVAVDFTDVRTGQVISRFITMTKDSYVRSIERTSGSIFIVSTDNNAPIATITRLSLAGDFIRSREIPFSAHRWLRTTQIGGTIVLAEGDPVLRSVTLHAIDPESLSVITSASFDDAEDVQEGVLVSRKRIAGDLGGSWQMTARALSIPARRRAAR
jgi:hypothetical protein